MLGEQLNLVGQLGLVKEILRYSDSTRVTNPDDSCLAIM